MSLFVRFPAGRRADRLEAWLHHAAGLRKTAALLEDEGHCHQAAAVAAEDQAGMARARGDQTREAHWTGRAVAGHMQATLKHSQARRCRYEARVAVGRIAAHMALEP